MSAPGGLDQHYGVVAATPALLAAAAAIAVALIGQGRSARIVAVIGLMPAMALQAALLVPSGIAWRCQGLHVGGWVLIHPLTIAVALVIAVITAALGDPWRGQGRSPAGWCLRIAIALALPTILFPALVLGIEHDHPEPLAFRPLRLGVALMASIGCWWWPLPCAIGMVVLLAVTVRGRWRWAAGASAVAMGVAVLLPYLVATG